MRPRCLLLTFLCFTAEILWCRPAPGQFLPDSIHSEGVPPVPDELDRTIDHYRFTESVTFQGWLAGTRRILYLSESGGVKQAFVCVRPGQPPWQLTESDRSVGWVYSHPHRERLVIATDEVGDDKYSFSLQDMVTGRSWSFVNGRWENEAAVWSRSGHLLAMSSDARNGKDRDLYVINPPYRGSGGGS